MAKPILCMDWDGVIHSYTSGWKGADVIPDPPVPGAIDFLEQAVKHFDVCVFSSRSHQENGIWAMEGKLHVWAAMHFARKYNDLGECLAALSSITDGVRFVEEKPVAMITLDDRAITFDGTWPEIETLLAFKPWNKK